MNDQIQRLYDQGAVNNIYKILMQGFIKDDNINAFTLLLSHTNVFFEDDILNESKGQIKLLLDYKPAKRVANKNRFLNIQSFYAAEKKSSPALLRMLDDQRNSSDDESSDSEIDDFHILRSRTPDEKKYLLARGVHFSPEYYKSSRRRRLRKPESHNHSVGSRATAKLAQSKKFPHPHQLIKGYLNRLSPKNMSWVFK